MLVITYISLTIDARRYSSSFGAFNRRDKSRLYHLFINYHRRDESRLYKNYSLFIENAGSGVSTLPIDIFGPRGIAALHFILSDQSLDAMNRVSTKIIHYSLKMPGSGVSTLSVNILCAARHRGATIH